MFIVYSPEGQKSISATNLKLNTMRVAKSKSDNPVGESDNEKAAFNIKDYQKNSNSEAIKKYTENKKPEHGSIVVAVEEIMTREVVTILASETVEQAWKLMTKYNINHLPVYSQDEDLIGLISSRDILKKLVVNDEGLLEASKIKLVRELMSPKVFSTLLKTDIRRAALVMAEFSVGCILIVNEKSKLLGVVSSHDLVRRLAEEPPVTLYV